MPTPKVEYEIAISRTGQGAQQAQQDFKNVDQAAQGMGRTISSVTAGLSRLGLAFSAGAFLRAAVQEFTEAEKATNKLHQALRGTAQFTPEAARQLKDLAQSLSDTTAFTDEAVTNVVAKLISFGASTKDVGRLTQAVLDLSTLLDKDLNRSVLTVGNALRGEFGQLQALGFKIDETKTTTANFNSVLEQLETKLGKGAQAAMEGAVGSFERAGKAINNLEQSVGRLVAALGPLIDRWADNTNKGAQFLDTLTKIQFIVDALSTGDIINASGFIHRGAAALRNGPSIAGHVGAAGIAGAGIPGTPSSSPGRGSFITRPGGVSARGTVTTAGLRDADMARARAMLEQMTQDMIRSEQTQLAEAIRVGRERQQIDERYFDQRQQFENELTLSSLRGEARVAAQIEIDHQTRLKNIRELQFNREEDYDAIVELERRLYNEQKRRHQLEQTAAFRLQEDLRRISEQGQELFSQGLAGAIVDAFEQGDKAFQAFARNFLSQISRMILQALILRAVQSGIGAIFGGGGNVSGATSGASAGASAGFSTGSFTEFSSSTARTIDPTTFSASLGSAHRAFVPAAAGAGAGGAGAGAGHLVIEVQVANGAEARIVKHAVERSVLRVTREMSTHGRLSSATKALTT